MIVSRFLANYAYVQRGSHSLSSDAFSIRKLNKSMASSFLENGHNDVELMDRLPTTVAYLL